MTEKANTKSTKERFTQYDKNCIYTDRLKLLPLKTDELKNLCCDLFALEKNLGIKYKATPPEGFFLEILKAQLEATKCDEDNYKFHSFWLIIRKSDRVVVGMADFKDVPNENGEVEIGYGLGEEFEHNGYMTETVKAMCNWAFLQKDVKAVTAETELDGTASQNILINCGFKKYSENQTAWWRLLK